MTGRAIPKDVGAQERVNNLAPLKTHVFSPFSALSWVKLFEGACPNCGWVSETILSCVWCVCVCLCGVWVCVWCVSVWVCVWCVSVCVCECLCGVCVVCMWCVCVVCMWCVCVWCVCECVCVVCECVWCVETLSYCYTISRDVLEPSGPLSHRWQSPATGLPAAENTWQAMRAFTRSTLRKFSRRRNCRLKTGRWTGEGNTADLLSGLSEGRQSPWRIHANCYKEFASWVVLSLNCKLNN